MSNQAAIQVNDFIQIDVLSGNFSMKGGFFS